MAKSAFSAVISNVRGEIDDTVFIHGRNGAVVRNKPTYGFPVTPNQRVTSNYFKEATAVYNTLTRPQVLAWNAYAKTITRHRRADGAAVSSDGAERFHGIGLQIPANQS